MVATLRVVGAAAATLAVLASAACTVSHKATPAPPPATGSTTTSATSSATSPVGTSAAPSTAGGAQRVIVTCEGDPAIQPQTYVLTCADANTRLAHLIWTGWGDATAHATGTLQMNTCTPNCAQGTFRDYPATVVARGSAVVGPGQVSYSTVQVNAAPLTGDNTWNVTGNGPG